MKIKKTASALNRSMRIGIATITSTAMLGGVLVAVPAHPLLPSAAIAQAQQITSAPLTQADIATAHALGIDLGLLNLNVLDAIEADDAWPNSTEGANNPLTLSALQALSLNFGNVSLPLVKTTNGNGLLDLGGSGLGLLGAAADAPGVTGISASTGVLAEDGSVNLDGSLTQGHGPAKLDILALTNQIGLDPVVSALIQELNLEIGALGSEIEKNGDTITSAYTVADLNLVLESSAVADIAGVLNGVGATLDTTISGLAGNAGLVNTITGALGPLTNTLGLGTPQVTLTSHLETTVQNLIGGEIFDGQTVEDSLVILNLDEGTIRVNLENLHAEGLNGRPANTELTAAELTLITDTVNDLVQELVDRVQAALQGGLSDTEVEVSIGVNTKNGDSAGIRGLLDAVVGLDIEKILEIVGGLATGLVGGIEIESTLGGLLGTPGYDAPRIQSTGTGLVLELLAPLLDGILSDVVSPLGSAVQTLLFAQVDGVLDDVLDAAPVNNLLTGLSPLLDAVLSDVLLITLNKQDNQTIAGQPGRKVTALDVQVLPVAGSTPLVQLGLGASQVSGPSTADLNKYAPEIEVVPNEGPFGEPNTVKIEGKNLVYVGSDDKPVSLVTELKFGSQTVPAGDITANKDGSLTVKVPVVNATNNGDDLKVTVTLTTGGGTATDEYTYVGGTVNPPAEAPTIEPIENQEIELGNPITTVNTVVTPEGAEVSISGQPAGVTIVDGVISGTPTRAGNFNVTVTATNEGLTASTSFKITVIDPDSDVDAPTIAPIADAEGTEEKEIDPIKVDVTPDDAEVDVDGLPDGVDYDPETGEISGTPEKGTEGSYSVTVTATNDNVDATETFTFVVKKDDNGGGDNGNGDNGSSDNGSSGSSDGTSNGSSDFLQQCLDSPAAGVAGLLVALGTVGAIAGPALEPLMKSIGAELDRALRNLTNASSGGNQPEWVRNINRGLNDAANAVDHRMVSQALFATAALALISTPVLCGMDNSSSSSS
ncbi:choice-of-anchor G family protein [Corynebacterium glutamicum]|uniref:choice-of-anchor G family protein n=1 Tax=Corynebacterium glutamicum TaxID=1718 RepID=UPI003C7C733B